MAGNSRASPVILARLRPFRLPTRASVPRETGCEDATSTTEAGACSVM